MFERLLLPLDGSELAELAIPYGEELSRRLGAEVILFHVLGPERLELEHEHRVYLDKIASTLTRRLREGQPQSASVSVRVQIEEGEPSANICRLVDDGGIDLIIMTSAGASGPKGARLGNVADHVCRTVPIPVLLIKPHEKRAESRRQLINRIPVPLDGSELSKLALPVGIELSSKLQVPIDLFQMARIISSLGGEPAPFVDYGKLMEDEERSIRTEMAVLAGELSEKGLTVAWSADSGTDAANEIIGASKKVGADLVVMSTHGRGGLGHLILGSVAERVLQQGETAMLLVHARAGRSY